MRGNPKLGIKLTRFSGPIPAGAGEPFASRARRRRRWAYPRGCGGTGPQVAMRTRAYGLSPRVRGNREYQRQDLVRSGPIPAGAGEPLRSAAHQASTGAYPRGCGGTVRASLLRPEPMGLSPRVRGNPAGRRSTRQPSRPIPAGAGEPAAPGRPFSQGRAYPRGCGGTSLNVWNAQTGEGLSPRVRGNRHETPRPIRRAGPIPAGAGEPLTVKSLIVLYTMSSSAPNLNPGSALWSGGPTAWRRGRRYLLRVRRAWPDPVRHSRRFPPMS